MPEIYSHTTLRGIAATLVFVVHLHYGVFMESFWFLSPYPVDLFFVLSGFILNWVYLGTGKPIHWGQYFWARAGRILPLYYLTLLVCLPLTVICSNEKPLAAWPTDLLLNLSLLSGVFNTLTFNGPAWSIGVEYFCYLLVFPVLVALLRLSLRSWLLIAISVIGILILSRGLVICHRGSLFQDAPGFLSNPFLQRGILGFTIGFLLCTIFLKVRNCLWPARLVKTATCFFLVLLFLALSKAIPPHMALYIMPFLVFFTAFDAGLVANCFKFRPLQWLGTRSYSIYLWHQPLIHYTKNLRECIAEPLYTSAILFFVFGISEVSYRYFEMPARSAIRSWGKKSNCQ
jgi:peptidoglycan/LPS O-acetylase OafA/YrhL